MKFKVSKVAAAVAVGLGTSVVGMNVAQADAILFPYFAVSATVTSLVTTINMAPQVGATAVNPQTLHYRLFYKRGATADNLTASCEEFDVRRVTSPNDIVTFDLQGRVGADTLGVIAEPANRQIKANYTAANQSFALMRNLIPARGFMVVDNDEAPNAPFENSLAGEIAVVDFAEGAIWGYGAYNAGPSNNPFGFHDQAERNGEVIAGDRAVQTVTAANPAGNDFPAGRFPSPAVPAAFLPVASAATAGDVYTRFFVTPIAHPVARIDKRPAGLPIVLQQGGNFGQAVTPPVLTTRIAATVANRTGTPNDVVFDRDENPISGPQPQNVVCVGAVPIESLLSAGALREVGDYGGWTGIQISSPGAMVTFANDDGNPATPNVIASRTNLVNQAVVIKLEYNPVGGFLGGSFPSSFNNSIWLRYGIRESVRGTTVGGAVELIQGVYGAYDINYVPIDVAEDFVGNFISVLSTFSR